MKFLADFHIHSHFSLATSRDLTPEHLDLWARIKGIKVVGTGDFTHPGWTEELKAKLEPAENGLYRLKPDLRIKDGTDVDASESEPRFLLTAEISTIYKRDDRTRKVHHVLMAPDFETVETFQRRMIRAGFNITSDGRPIIGLDSRDLFEMALEISESIVLVPAHIWTPWFSVLGDKSGFDSIRDCYGELTDRIFAVETGLSSDPAMNWRLSALDRYSLISNSDAHSPSKLGREANRFDTELSYPAIMDALRSQDNARFLGTVEFFPEEGKYHLDGHRACNVRWEPEETLRHDRICTVCGKPVTVGVLHRVAVLADREKPGKPNAAPFFSVIPLVEVIAEIQRATPQSKSVVRDYQALIRLLGSELGLMLDLPLESIKKTGGERLAEAIRRMRLGEVILDPGFDGEYGKIKVFREGETESLALFDEPIKPKKKSKRDAEPLVLPIQDKTPSASPKPEINQPANFDPAQKAAVEHGEGPALVIAGPGSGKTRVLVGRVLHLVLERGVPAGQIAAVTFTLKAMSEMRFRLTPLLGERMEALTLGTFHALGQTILKTHADLFGRTENFSILDEADRKDLLNELAGRGAGKLAERINLIKQGILVDPDIESDTLWLSYETWLSEHDAFDIDDLIEKPGMLFERRPNTAELWRNKLRWILVDECQDINPVQYRLLRHLAPAAEDNLFWIGDPNQAIYGFRGADVKLIGQFRTDYPGAKEYQLETSYRCPAVILGAARDVLRLEENGSTESPDKPVVEIRSFPTDRSEAEFIARTVEDRLGGTRFFSMDSRMASGEGSSAPGDFAVLCRIGRMAETLAEAFDNHGIPYRTADVEPFYRKEPCRSIIKSLKASVFPDARIGAELVDKSAPITIEEISGISVAEAVRQTALRLGGQPDSTDAIRHLLDLAGEFGDDLDRFLRFVSMSTGLDVIRRTSEAVSLLTLHAAKGLEFPHVFIAGCEDGLLPYRMFGDPGDVEEERRLLYVGMTRARETLTLTHAEKRTLFNRTYQFPRSPFLDDIKFDRFKTFRMEKKTVKKTDQLGLFDGSTK